MWALLRWRGQGKCIGSHTGVPGPPGMISPPIRGPSSQQVRKAYFLRGQRMTVIDSSGVTLWFFRVIRSAGGWVKCVLHVFVCSLSVFFFFCLRLACEGGRSFFFFGARGRGCYMYVKGILVTSICWFPFLSRGLLSGCTGAQSPLLGFSVAVVLRIGAHHGVCLLHCSGPGGICRTIESIWEEAHTQKKKRYLIHNISIVYLLWIEFII